MPYRHEYKHRINMADYLILDSKIKLFAEPDENCKNGSYFIRSLYFDNATDKALREKIDGVNMREKFRIRMYNGDVSYIKLEKKSKINGLCQKSSVCITQEQASAIIKGDCEWMKNVNEPLITELYIKMKTQGLKPKTIVDYTREPFVYAPGNVRVTLDYNIRTGICTTDFLNPSCVTVPANNDAIILEVKWDEFLPDIIRDIVHVKNTRTVAFSKYAACRLYG